MSNEPTFAANPANLAVSREDTGTLTDSADQLASLEAYIRQHTRLLFKVAYGVLRNSHDAEDVVQETVLRVHRSGFGKVRDVPSWLATIAFRLALDRKRKPEELELAEIDIPANNTDAEHLAIHHQQVERLRTLMASLPDDLRFPLVLAAIEELNSRQSARCSAFPNRPFAAESCAPANAERQDGSLCRAKTMTNDNQFDHILDHALSEYPDAEPLSGLENRGLRRLQSQPNSRSVSWRLARLPAFATSAALLLLAIFLITRSHPPQPLREQASSTSPAPAAVQASPPPVKNSPVASARRPEPQTSMNPKWSDVQSLAATPSPVQAFPTPLRITNEEHALVAVATTHPDVLQASVREDELITIAPVVIKPLASSTEHESE